MFCKTVRYGVKFAKRFAFFASGASAETGLTKNGTVLRFEVEQGDTLQWSDPFPEDATAFFKTGPGTLELSSDNASFKGSAAVPPALRS